LFIALLAGLGWSLAMAAAPQEAWNQPYAEKTAALGLKGDIGRGELAFVICQGCHRVGALGRADGSYPRLAGQHVTVLIKQLTDVRSGRRSNPKMLPFADHQALSVQDIADIAAYLQALPAAADQGRGSGVDLARGSQLYERDCLVCHGRQGEGKADSFYPKVAGQHYIYLLREGSMIRDGKRSNAHPDMIDVVKKYSDADMDAVSDYMSRLPVHLH
jgi:cytochrome c553